MKNEFFKRILSSILLIPLSLFIIINGSILFNLFILFCLLITVYEWKMMVKKKVYKIFGIIFLILSFYTIYILRNKFDAEYFYVLFIGTICVSTDIGGYIFGKVIGGPKLTSISPKKTYSGMIGGYSLSLMSIMYFNKDIVITIKLILIIFIISSISQLGDIFISYFKRLSNVKDTGRIIPGHGGLLDRIDGMIFAFPFSYLIFSTNYFKII